MASWKDDQVIEDTAAPAAASFQKNAVDQIPGATDAQGQSYYQRMANQPKAAVPKESPSPLSMAAERAVGMGSPVQRLTGGLFVKPALGANELLWNVLAGGSDLVQSLQGNDNRGEGFLRGFANSASNLSSEYARQEREGQAANTALATDVPFIPDVGGEGFNALGLFGGVLSPTNKFFGFSEPVTKTARVAKGALQGGLQATIAPTEQKGNYFDQKAQDGMLGTLLGGMFPVGAMAIRGGKKLADELAKPLTTEGKQKLIREWFNKLLPAEKSDAIDALTKAQELVPGSKPTSAQALAGMPTSTSLAAAESKVSGNADSKISQKFAQRAADQQAAREFAISGIAKTKDELDAAITDRKDFADAFYNVAYKQLTDFNPQLKGMMQTPAFRAAIPKALEIAKNNGFQTNDDLAKLVTYAPDFFKGVGSTSKKEVVNSNLTQFLHFVKKAMDEQVQRPEVAGGLGNTEKAAVQNVRKQLVSWMGKNNAYYDDARQVYAAMSPKIDQMRVGQTLLEKLKTPLDVERAAVFSQAVFDAPKTIKKATGETVYETIEEALTPKQAAAVRAVDADLKRAKKADFNAQRTSIAGVNADNAPELPALFNTAATVTNAVLRTMKKGTNEELNAQIADLLLDPKKLAAFLTAMPKEPGKAKAFASALMSNLTPENQAALAAQLSTSQGQ